MTLRQEAYEKLTILPDSGLKIVIAVADEIIRQANTGNQEGLDSTQLSKKQAAVENIFRLRAESPVPTDFDWKNAREEAIQEKYGNFV